MPTLADLKQSACAVALLVLAAASAPGGASESSPDPSTPQSGFIPTAPERPPVADSPLIPSRPTERDAALATLEQQSAQGVTLAPPDETPLAPVIVVPVEQRADAPRLHQDLGWEYCGPAPGVTEIAPASPPPEAQRLPIEITADLVDYDRERDLIQLQGEVDIVQESRRLRAERSRYDRRSGDVSAAGGVELDYPELRVIGERADYNLETKRGHLEQTGYRMHGRANLRGAAAEAWLLDDERSRYRDVLYTTCAPGNSAWSLRARDLELDQGTGQGVARHARLRLWDVPVLYTPYLTFPIDGRRRSGFLIPTVGTSEETGFDLTIPYYWNIAPNMDATLTPRLMSSRGLMLGAEFRHLSPWQRIELDGELLPSDWKNEDEGVRGALRVNQSAWFGTRWSTAIDYASVSDDRYLVDFGNRLDVTSLRNLSQRADVLYSGDGWWALGRVQQFQTVDTSIAPANRPYGQLPHIELNLSPDTLIGGLEYDFKAQYDYFDHNAAVHGSRLVAIPALRWPLRRGFGHLIPRARLYYTQYDLADQAEGADSQPSHLIPSVDLDGKLIFEREADWFGHETLQTLEPRLYYVLTAHEDQSDNPRFDTTALDFSFASLFRSNRFTGYDRISDENRLTLGLTSRTIANRDGDELLRASLGQIYYFDERRVQLDASAPRDDTSSSLAGELAARLHRDWTAQVGLQWNPHDDDGHAWEKQILQLRYAPDRERLINLAYRYNLGSQASEEYEDTDLAFQMPIGPRVRVVGRWLYSLLNDETVEAFAGLEFGQCCWRLRVLGQHLKRDADQPASTSVMLQLELAGLGSFGNSIDKVLQRGIYGYQSE
ncbi:LPS-assembly protein LptD [Allochromatium vinosum]|uniref:LPS-assembly protein LptD n=1 Tax=Allochromatium vinosum TaxID=1049 RepID=UPI00190442D5|nr:LPS-assembly protein LptD [Allochromatium vinosum]MBK1653878.1 organic solvent tolerance protein [Allochromatium vinosum]